MAGPSEDAAPGAAWVERGGARLALLPERALWWPARQALLVADVHFGKAASFRSLGVPVPEGTTGQTLDRLGVLLARLAVRHLVFLGDFLHAARGRAPGTLQALADWRASHAAVAMTLVRGNHDDRAGDPPPGWRIDVVDEPLHWDGLALCHHPGPRPGAYVLAGHLHPCIHVGRGFERLRLPCFHFSAAVGVLPAFGSFTGMHPVRPARGDAVFAVAGDVVQAL